MKKILFVIASFYGGGAERALSNILMNFPDDWDCELLINCRTDKDFSCKGKVHSLNLASFGTRKSLWYLLKEIVVRSAYLKNLKKTNQYDACVSFLDSANISNILSGNKYCKTIISIRVDMLSKESKQMYRVSAIPLFSLLYRTADKIVTVSREVEANLTQRFGLKNTKTIVNGYDFQKIQLLSLEEIDKSLNWDNKKIVITVGRLDEQKGQWHLIRSFLSIIKQIPESVLLIIGEGKLYNYLDRLISQLGLTKHVFLLGYCKNPFAYLARADVFILPSMYEGYPNSLAEALCCGIPCIATDFHSGAREILAPTLDVMGKRVEEITEAEFGILIPMCSGKKNEPGDLLEKEEMKMSEAILTLLRDEAKNKRYRKKSLERAKDLDIENIVKEWIDIIQKE